ncbi:MAG: discoidin domain-containing protein [Acidimicrobiales bacterium]
MRPRRRSAARLLAALLTLTLLAAACGDDDDESGTDGDGSAEGGDNAEIFDFAEVQASDFVFEADPADPTRGIFRVTTTEPMICAIVWGEDGTFGRFNNSLAMNGTGIIEHDVFLPDLVQGEPYAFRVQGTTADGRQFRSDTLEFTIPVTEPVEGGASADELGLGQNLTPAATVSDFSSEFSAAFAATNAIDGDPGTEWSTRGDGDEGFITVDLGGATEIGGVSFVTRSMADGSAITDTFTVTVDGGETFGPFPAGSPADERIAQFTATGSELRFDVETSTGGNVGAIDIAVYESG